MSIRSDIVRERRIEAWMRWIGNTPISGEDVGDVEPGERPVKQR